MHMRRHLVAMICAAGFIAVTSAAALAQPDVELAFDPTEVYPGDQVNYSFSIENLGPDPSLIDLETTISDLLSAE